MTLVPLWKTTGEETKITLVANLTEARDRMKQASPYRCDNAICLGPTFDSDFRFNLDSV